jgi:hypothetical protein
LIIHQLSDPQQDSDVIYTHTDLSLATRREKKRRKCSLPPSLPSEFDAVFLYASLSFVLAQHSDSLYHLIVQARRKKFKASDCTIDVRQRGLLWPAHPISTGIGSILFLVECTSMKLL